MLVRWSVGHGWMDVLSQTPWEVPAVQGLLLGHGDHRRNKVSSLFHRIRFHPLFRSQEMAGAVMC